MQPILRMGLFVVFSTVQPPFITPVANKNAALFLIFYIRLRQYKPLTWGLKKASLILVEVVLSVLCGDKVLSEACLRLNQF